MMTDTTPLAAAKAFLRRKGIAFSEVDGMLRVPGDIHIFHADVTNDCLPNLSMVECQGSFNCIETQITSLVGAPHTVGGNFYCSHNHLNSLAGAPQTVGGDFSCRYNPLADYAGLSGFRALYCASDDTRATYPDLPQGALTVPVFQASRVLAEVTQGKIVLAMESLPPAEGENRRDAFRLRLTVQAANAKSIAALLAEMLAGAGFACVQLDPAQNAVTLTYRNSDEDLPKKAGQLDGVLRDFLVEYEAALNDPNPTLDTINARLGDAGAVYLRPDDNSYALITRDASLLPDGVDHQPRPSAVELGETPAAASLLSLGRHGLNALSRGWATQEQGWAPGEAV